MPCQNSTNKNNKKIVQKKKGKEMDGWKEGRREGVAGGKEGKKEGTEATLPSYSVFSLQVRTLPPMV